MADVVDLLQCWADTICCAITASSYYANVGIRQYLGPAASPTSGCTIQHSVNGDDRCWLLQRQYGLTSAEFATLNPGVDCLNLQISQPLCLATRTVPGNVTCLLKAATSSNSTCDAISSQSGLGRGELQALNPGLDCSNLTALRAIPVLCVQNATIPVQQTLPPVCTK